MASSFLVVGGLVLSFFLCYLKFEKQIKRIYVRIRNTRVTPFAIIFAALFPQTKGENEPPTNRIVKKNDFDWKINRYACVILIDHSGTRAHTHTWNRKWKGQKYCGPVRGWVDEERGQRQMHRDKSRWDREIKKDRKSNWYRKPPLCGRIASIRHDDVSCTQTRSWIYYWLSIKSIWYFIHSFMHCQSEY